MKKLGIGLLVFFAVLLAALLGGYLWVVNTVKNEMASLVYEKVDMDSITDGTYYGQADAGLVIVKLEVTVKDKKIESITVIQHQNGLGAKAEAITEDIIAQNNYDVDGVSGATLSSEAIKSAVSKALKKGCLE